MSPYTLAIKINEFFKTLALDLPVKIVLTKKTYKYFDDFIKEQERFDDAQMDGFRSVGVNVEKSDLREFLGKGLKLNQFRLMGIVFEEE